MAVTFAKGSFTIEVKECHNPVESWLEMHSEMIDLLQSENIDMHSNRYAYLELLRNMLPDEATARKMLTAT